MNIQTIPLEDLNPAIYNPRIERDAEFDGLCTSLRKYGQTENLIANKDMTLISGHQRYEAMKFLKWSEAVVNVVDLTKKQEKQLNLVMNNPNIQGRFDDEKLADILDELKMEEGYAELRLDKLEPLDMTDKRKKRQLLTCPECQYQGEIGDYKRIYEDKL